MTGRRLAPALPTTAPVVPVRSGNHHMDYKALRDLFSTNLGAKFAASQGMGVNSAFDFVPRTERFLLIPRFDP